MTTIAGVIDTQGTAWLGGDSCVSSETATYTQADPKVWVSGAVAIGCCGAALWEGLMRDWEPRSAPPTRPSAAWLRRELTPYVRRAERCEDADEGGEALLGYGGKLWCLTEADGALWPLADTWCAVGSGELAARGCLWALRKVSAAQPEWAVLQALQAAEALTPGTRKPFHVVRVAR